jgi:hypothetical protein
MRNGPRLTVTCGRCGQPRRGIRHDCVASGRAARRKATPKLNIDFGKCPDCRKPVGNPLTHVCSNKGDFKRRKARHEREQKAKARKKRQAEKHDYLACKDDECPRPLCVAYKTGWRDGYKTGFDDGYSAGYAAGFTAGLASCPGPHGGG